MELKAVKWIAGLDNSCSGSNMSGMFLQRKGFVESLIVSMIYTCFGIPAFWIIDHFNFSRVAGYFFIGGLIIIFSGSTPKSVFDATD
ncbi:hypothetical protein [Paenibacillus sp. YN15]|uniref:hypothetical protein n=1 Tax=Paenibacillus sp. YN15 TaxID=1742774 RepID=UPI000DCC4F09|nr:hypothetical protein [Paenibacillus sp. YN15]RAV05529.1 hypothetical protein DQG13_02600 [Paenibacillus sp. YN15]